jgi:uncharacterized membrane protein
LKYYLGIRIKKYALITVLSLFCVLLYAEETVNIRAGIYSPKIIKSNGKETFDLSITNGESMAMNDLMLLVSNDGDLEIILDKIKIDTIEPKETVIVNMEIINTQKYYFSKDTLVTLKISNNQFTKDFSYKFTIKPVEKFWFFVIISIVTILIVLFVFIFIKINKGEKNVG